MLAAAFAGDRRVWRVAAICAVPFVLVSAYYCLRPRFYYTGSDSVEDASYLHVRADAPICVSALELPAGTAVVRLRVESATRQRPALALVVRVDGHTIRSQLPAAGIVPDAPSNVDFAIPPRPAQPAARLASLCVTAAGALRWGGTPLSKPAGAPVTVAGRQLSAQIAVWYLPKPGARLSYVQQAGAIFARAALFRPGVVGAWTYPLLLFALLPALALAAVRCLALAFAGHGRRLAAWLFAIAALNAGCWALITPVFQGPDEVDHFAYVQSLVERGEGPSHDPHSKLERWSGAENRALEDAGFFTDHQVGDAPPPWLRARQRAYEREVAFLHPRTNDGGGFTTSAAHGPLYYLTLSPAYLLTRHASIFSQLTLMRLTSALLGALTVLFTFLLVRELAPGRAWLAVLAALLVAYEPMYSFISGIVNNDVGVNACAAALELLLIRMLRRGITIRWGLLTGAVLIALPIVKGTGLSLYPVAALVFAATLWRHHSRSDLYAFAGLALGAVLVAELSAHVLSLLQPAASASGTGAIGSNASAVHEALHHIPKFLAYLWQALLPRLPFMPRYFPSPTGFVLFSDPGFVIFVERGWGAFGWYDVFFVKWVYVVIFLAMLATVALGVRAVRRERGWVRAHWLELLALVAMPVAVVVGFVAAYYQPAPRVVIAEFGRYAFPAIGPLAVLVVGALHAFGRRRMHLVGVGLLVAMIALSYASQLLTLTSFYA
jgi:4-amino-4-deoxy-L-arabinose transferase-like glycosyltransferase